MAKVQKLSDIQQEIAFTEFDFYLRYEESFKTTEFGRIKCLLPLREMAISFGLIEEKPNNFRPKLGRKSFFTPEEEAFSFMAASMLFPLAVQTAFTLRVSVRETDWSAGKEDRWRPGLLGKRQPNLLQGEQDRDLVHPERQKRQE